MRNKQNSGFTLVEVSASASLLVMTLGLAVTGYIFALKNVNVGDAQGGLDIDVRISMESLKQDLRLSSLDTIFYFPEGSGPYEAISFPKAYDSDGDGLVERDDESKLIWSETVIYHIRPTTPNELVKTTFSPRNNALTDAQRQAQLEAVVKAGDGKDTYNGRNATSKVLFSNLVNWKINPKEAQFDAYASTLTRERANLGYMLLDSGDHEITFTVTGKHDESKGYSIGVDQLSVSGSASPREAEAQLPASSEVGASAMSAYVSSGSWKGNHHLYFPANAIGNSFSLKMENDRWEETNFTGLGYQAEDARIEFDEMLLPSDFIVQLDGMDDTWDAESQTGSYAYDPPATWNMQNWVVRVMQKGSELADNGNWFAYNGRKCRLTFDSGTTGNLRIFNIFIGESASTTNASMDFNTATIQPVLFGGANSSPTIGPGQSMQSDWVDLEIDKEKNYLVSYRIANDFDKAYPAIWPDTYSSVSMSTMVVTNGSSATAKDATWSDRAGIGPMPIKGVVGLSAIEASYPAEGEYTSQIFDTHLDEPTYHDISWNADLPAGTALSFKVRTGDYEDLSDADDWDAIAAFSSSRSLSVSYKRYVQFKALMESSDDGLETPKLKDVTIDWDGGKQLVDISGIFTKGPEFGTFEVSVDGEPLRSALIVDLEIYKDILGMKGQTRRVTSSLKADLTPRNSGM